MEKRQYLLLIVLTVISGHLGGAVSNWVFMARTAVAQDEIERKNVITAERIELVCAIATEYF